MAKFAIALCLLVASTGIQGSSLLTTLENAASAVASTMSISAVASAIDSEVSSLTSSTSSSSILSVITSTSTSGITTFVTEVETIFSEMETAFQSLLTEATSIESVANATIVSATSEIATVVESYSNSNVDLSSCTTVVTEFEILAASAMNETTVCASTYITDITTDYEETVSAMADLLEDLYDMAKEANSCSIDDFFTYISCMAEAVADLSTTAATDFATVMADAATLMTEMSEVETKLESCGISSAVSTLQDNLVTYIAEYAECAEALGATATE
ncbi:bypass of stop codon protein 1-like [Diprion similis]|uniref:bypass of stop codon protein 1-like n=1 Tax=Diprion similis TaxID=362088 RepID=UPI001EF805DB|nr:bypass of stop codon protein 1-like [Diprion similis]